ncbi:glycosyltransferase [Actinoplanes subtropicus]|uniref:glycosyltransferase n=1 Tax=Actinoplanes subtropicus TaxID=543632 RepID=UPI0004C44C06|nr:glycosyltransferase [Actinoplanes subtropicus]
MTPLIDVVLVAGHDWRPAVRRLRGQTRPPARVIVETASPVTGDPGKVTVVPPGRGIATATADWVALLGEADDPYPAWLAEVATAAGVGADAVAWGVLTLDGAGIVESVDLPPATAGTRGRPAPGIAFRRSLATSDGRLPRRTRVTGLPRLLSTRPARDPVTCGSPTVSVILPVRNAAATLGDQLDALAAQDYRGAWELIVVDNGSTDHSAAVADARRDRLPGLRTISAPAARSAGVARNAGVRAAAGERLVFCDADDVADPGWLTAMVAALADADLVGGALDCSVLSPAFMDEQPAPLPAQGEPLPFARSANCGIRRSVLHAVGGWAEHFRGGAGEDVELSWRVQLAGYRLAYAPAARMGYRLRPTLSGVARQKWSYGLTGALLFRTFRNAGYRRRPWRQVLLSWLWMLRHLPDLGRPGTPRRRWVRYAARLAGFAAGSVRHRAAYF